MKLRVDNLGRIKEAEVELAPLVILVGKNNTGKSYLATALWALGSLAQLDRIGRRQKRPQWFTDFVAPINGPTTRSLVINEQRADEIKAALQRRLKSKSKQFLSQIFAFDGFDGVSVRLEGTKFQEFTLNLSVAGDSRDPDEEKDPTIYLRYISSDTNRTDSVYPKSLYDDLREYVADSIYNNIVGYTIFGEEWINYRRAIYIPAARTGIMLAMPALVESSLDGSGSFPARQLPLPLSNFLRQMARPPFRHGSKAAPIKERLKQQLMCGEIETTSGPSREFTYVPEGTAIRLPLHATSSMITELTPLAVALDMGIERQHVVFEEPEAHLHLEAQREMARLIARLVAAGGRVTLTTHSDTFIQQINNLMALHEHPKRSELMKKFGYEKNDLIDPHDTRAYEFCSEDGKTYVRPVEMTSNGFVIETLNKTLLDLAKETIELRK